MTESELKGLDQLDQLQRCEYGTIRPLLDQNSFIWYGVSVFGDGVLECAQGACTDKGLVADVHVCMMCNQSATASFVIKAVATSRHNLWHNLWHVWSILHLVVLELLDVACQFATHATSEVVSSISFTAKLPEPFCMPNKLHVIIKYAVLFCFDHAGYHSA